MTTLGGECSVSLAPFSHLLSRYGDALAIVWVDSHPDMGTGATEYSGFHATVVSALTGHGAPDVLDALPATTEPSRVVLEGMHDWPDATLPAVAAQWGLTVFSPDALRSGSGELLDWLAQTGASKVAIHFDVDTSPASLVGVPMR